MRGVPVSQGCSPFTSTHSEQQFYAVLENVVKANIVPVGLGLNARRVGQRGISSIGITEGWRQIKKGD